MWVTQLRVSVSRIALTVDAVTWVTISMTTSRRPLQKKLLWVEEVSVVPLALRGAEDASGETAAFQLVALAPIARWNRPRSSRYYQQYCFWSLNQ
jgi:hypothetical protein